MKSIGKMRKKNKKRMMKLIVASRSSDCWRFLQICVWEATRNSSSGCQDFFKTTYEREAVKQRGCQRFLQIYLWEILERDTAIIVFRKWILPNKMFGEFFEKKLSRNGNGRILGWLEFGVARAWLGFEIKKKKKKKRIKENSLSIGLGWNWVVTKVTKMD